MNPNMLKSPALLTIAVGAGVAIGAAGVFLYEHLVKEKRRLILQQEVMTLGMSVTELRREVEELRGLHRIKRKHRRSNTATTSESDPDVVSPEDDDDIFYELSDDEKYFAVVSRGEWHDEGHDKRFSKLDKQISDIDLSVKEDAYRELMELNEANPNDAEVLWRLAKVCHGMSTIKGLMDDNAGKRSCVEEAVQHATLALALSPRSAEVHKWYAITIGSRTEYQPTKLKIKDGFVFKEHIEEAIKISPNDPTLLHLLGRFRFEVATLSWVERKIAASLFGEVPYSTFPEALELLLKVEVLSKEPWKENRLIIAKCYINMGEYTKAIEWLDNAYEVESHSLEETRVHVEVQQLLDKYEKHRKKK